MMSNETGDLTAAVLSSGAGQTSRINHPQDSYSLCEHGYLWTSTQM